MEAEVGIAWSIPCFHAHFIQFPAHLNTFISVLTLTRFNFSLTVLLTPLELYFQAAGMSELGEEKPMSRFRSSIPIVWY